MAGYLLPQSNFEGRQSAVAYDTIGIAALGAFPPAAISSAVADAIDRRGVRGCGHPRQTSRDAADRRRSPVPHFCSGYSGRSADDGTVGRPLGSDLLFAGRRLFLASALLELRARFRVGRVAHDVLALQRLVDRNRRPGPCARPQPRRFRAAGEDPRSRNEPPGAQRAFSSPSVGRDSSCWARRPGFRAKSARPSPC